MPPSSVYRRSGTTADARRAKESPGLPRLQVVSNKGEAPRGNEPLDAPILSQGTNQARREARKRPDDGPGLATSTALPGSAGDPPTNAAVAARFDARQ